MHCQSHGRGLGSAIVVMTSLHYPDTRRPVVLRRPISKTLGAGGIYHVNEHLPRFNRPGSTFDAYMMPPYGY